MMEALAISPHPEASALGNRLLQEGRSAAEAAVAMAALLSVAMPHFCGLGGDAVWLIADRDGRVRALNGIGQAWASVAAFTRIETRGPASILTSAAAVATWQAALEAFGHTKPDLNALLSPAIGAARDGIVVTPSQEFWRGRRAGESAHWLGFGRYRDAAAGDTLRQPALADSLEHLRAEGLASFYAGPLATRIRDDLRSLGLDVTADDLRLTRVELADPLRLEYRGTMLHAPPPPTQGATTLEIMGILQALGPAPDMGSAADYHFMVESVKGAFLDRRELDDSPEGRERVGRFLSGENLRSRAAEIDRSRARPWPEFRREADTVYVAARDKAGTCVSALQSTYFDWGSGCCLPQTGIIWHNRGAAFSSGDGPNRLAPGRRPFHTLSPGIATREGRSWLLYGTQGADGQPQTLTVLLRHAIDHGLGPAEALARPRFLLGRTFSDNRDTLKLEPLEAEDELRALGHAISALPAFSALAGQAGMIRIEGRSVTGCHDPRAGA